MTEAELIELIEDYANAEVAWALSSDQNVELVEAKLCHEKMVRAIKRLTRYAELGETAFRFIDRAGDPHPGIDDAETICKEFEMAMVAVLEKRGYP